MAGRVERLEFSSQSLLINLKLIQKNKECLRQIFYSCSPVESWHINERGLFNIQTANSGQQCHNENVNNLRG